MATIGTNFRFGGLATGLDSQAIIDALVGVERIPILRLESQKSRLSQQDTIFTKINAKLAELRSKAEALDTNNELASYAVTSSNEAAVTATTSGTTVAGSYAISVSQLARTQSRTTEGFADANTTNVGTGSISLTVGGTAYDIALGNSTNTLEGVRDAINNSSAPVTAAVINDGSATNPWRLVLTSDETGTSKAFTADLSAFTAAVPAFNLNTELQMAKDAVFTVNNLQVTRSSNTVSDVIAGLTLKLKSEGALATSNVAISSDPSGIRKKVEDLVNAYNSILAEMTPQNVVDSKGKTTAVLFGDSGLRTIQARLRSGISTPTTGTGSVYNTLSSVGVKTAADGKLSLDGTKFDAAVAADLQGVMALFTTATGGVAATFKKAADDITNPNGGIIDSRRDGIQSRIRTIDQRVADLELRVTKFEERMIQRFATLETLVSKFQAQGSALGSTFNQE